jgi:hypothetical protein
MIGGTGNDYLIGLDGKDTLTSVGELFRECPVESA